MARFGITLTILGDYRDLFSKLDGINYDLSTWFCRSEQLSEFLFPTNPS